MTVNDMCRLKAAQANVADSLQLIACVVIFDFSSYVGKYSVPYTLANVKSLAIPWVYEAIDVGLELLGNVVGKRDGGHLRPEDLSRAVAATDRAKHYSFVSAGS